MRRAIWEYWGDWCCCALPFLRNQMPFRIRRLLFYWLLSNARKITRMIRDIFENCTWYWATEDTLCFLLSYRKINVRSAESHREIGAGGTFFLTCNRERKRRWFTLKKFSLPRSSLKEYTDVKNSRTRERERKRSRVPRPEGREDRITCVINVTRTEWAFTSVELMTAMKSHRDNRIWENLPLQNKKTHDAYEPTKILTE